VVIDVVVPVYAKNAVTEAMAHASLANLKDGNPEARVIVVDNGAAADRDFPHDVYVRLTENRGFAGGTNTGLALTESEFIGVSSIDVFMPPGTIRQLVDRRAVVSPLARRWRYGVETDEWEQPRCCFWGGLFVMHREVYEATGGMDEQTFPLRFSDTDFGVRCAKAGFRLRRSRQAVVEHHDPSISTLFMNDDDMRAEYDRLFAVHGEFTPDAWSYKQWR
jgi:GT2 family glycosyltransferase